jgi:hypothetical protein
MHLGLKGLLCTTFSSLRHLQRRSTSIDVRDFYQRKREVGLELAYLIWRTTCNFHGKCTYLLHAAKLRHGTDGFTSPPKESMLRIFFRPKNLMASAGFEPANSLFEGLKKVKVKGRFIGLIRHCSHADLLYPCPQGVPSFISRVTTHHTGTRDLY